MIGRAQENPIKIYRGDDTNFNNGTFLQFNVTANIDISEFTAQFDLGGISKKEISLADDGKFTVNFTSAETSQMPWGLQTGILRIFDKENRVKTVSNSILFLVSNEVVGEQPQSIVVPVPEDSPVHIELNIGGGISSVNWGDVKGDIYAQQDLQDEFATKQDLLTSEQMQAVNSGITADKVTAYDGYAADKQDTLTVAQLNAVNSGITAAKVSTYDGYATTIAGKQDALTTAEQTAVDSGIDSEKVSQISTNTNDISGLQSSKQDVINDLSTIRSGAALGATALQSTDVINTVDSTATTKPLSANIGKELNDRIDNISARGRFLALWNCATGLAETQPVQSPYSYHSGDYFIVGTVAQPGQTNYMPTGSSYTTGVPSTVVETEAVESGDCYYYDGTSWKLQVNTQKEIAFQNIAGDPYDNTNLATAFNAKQASITSNSKLSSDLVDDTNQTNQFVTASEKSTWNSKQDAISDLSTIRSGAAAGATAVQPGDLATVATSGNYNDLLNKPIIPAAQVNADWNASSGVAAILNKPSIPTVNNATLTIQKNGTDVATFTANSASNVTANINVPTDTNELTNGAGFITSSAISNMQTTSNLVTSVSSASTDTQYPSAKLFYDTCGDIENLINNL